jgi:Fe-S cluster assembly iron-binding protein IscA
VGCGGSALETLSQGARGHGFGEEEVTALLEDVNTAFDESPQMPSDVTITEPAAREFAKIAAGEGKNDQILRIVTDGNGGFCLEFETETQNADPSFANPAVPEISVRVSPLILRRVGGATIDWKNGRFALDLLDDGKEGCGCAGGGACGCKGGSCGCK